MSAQDIPPGVAAPPPGMPVTQGRRVAAGTVKVFAADALVVPTGILVAAFLTRSLGPELYGLFTVAVSIVLWIEIGVAMLLNRTAVKFVAEADDWAALAGLLNRVQLGVSLVAMALLMAAAPVIAAWLHAPSLSSMLRLLALDIPLLALASLHRAFLIGRGAFDRVIVPSAARWLVRLALVVVLVSAGLSVTGAILGTLGASLTALLVTRVYVRPPLWGRRAVAIPGLWRYAVPLFLGAMATQLFSRLDLLMVKAMVNATGAAGFYAAAQNMAIAPGLLAAAFSPLLLSALSGLVRDGKDGEVRSLIDHAFRLMLVVLPFVGIAAAAAPDLAAIVYGGPFVLAGPAAGILFFAATALFIASVTAAIITALGRPTLALALSAPLVPFALAAHLAVIPRFGLVGAAAVTAVFAWIAAASGVLAVARLARVRLPLSGWLRIIAVTVAASVLSHAWRTPTAWLVVELLLMAGGVLASLWAWGAITAADIAVARSLISRSRPAGTPGEDY